ncbi:sensor histidine kinase [Sunxiuqinia elliptica]|uniref:sensor histidine kinase n=1 Tax=Sunxiuqinia elliptica TaxID=655355 RepID=UPI001479FBCA|nr:histidine kinase [Sunxiuqinia elliptica]
MSEFKQYGTDYIFFVLGFIAVSESTLYLDRNYHNGIYIKGRGTYNLRITKYIPIGASYIVIFAIYIIIYQEDIKTDRSSVLFIVFSAIYVGMFDLILLTHNYYKRLRKERIANEILKEEKLKSDLKALQNQINPHFLFNSLNVLISEIYFNQEKAVKYTQHLSDIYRYVLQSTQKSLVELKMELEFLSSYIYMFKTKYGDGFQVIIDINSDFLKLEVPPLALQVLVENSIKHNAISPSLPLIVKIYSSQHKIVVSNNITQKKNLSSDSTGLKNLDARYRILADKEISIEHSETEFRVTIPLL